MHRKWWNLIRIRTIDTGAEPGGGSGCGGSPPPGSEIGRAHV